MTTSKFDLFLPKNYIQGFLVIKDKNHLRIAPGYCGIKGNYYFHKKIMIKDWTKTWREDINNGVLCESIKVRKPLWYHLYICGTGKKSYQFLLDDNMIGNHLLVTNPRICTFRKIFSIRL